VLSSTNGDLLADEIVNENPNPPPHAAPADIEVIEETKYDMNTLCCDDVGTLLCVCYLLCVLF